ncbi:DUF896 domain-containing protein [Bacillaceae bacterium W0354]
MLSKEKLDRINELARKSKKQTLSDQEKEEQKKLREEYLSAFRSGFKNQLHSIKVVDQKGEDVTPNKLKNEKEKHKKH